MKTLARISLPVLAIAVALQIQSAQAIPIDHYTLTLIENSSTSLTYTYDGSGGNLAFTILNTGTDTWTVTTTPQCLAVFTPFIWDWIEPEEPNEVNEVNNGFLGNSNNLYVSSDESLLEYEGNFLTLLQNNTPAPVPIGTDGARAIFLVFNDLAQGSEGGNGVADNGSTLALLALPLVGFGLLSLRRFRVPRLA